MKVYGEPLFAANVPLSPANHRHSRAPLDLPDKNKSINGQLFPKYTSSTTFSCFSILDSRFSIPGVSVHLELPSIVHCYLIVTPLSLSNPHIMKGVYPSLVLAPSPFAPLLTGPLQL